jgi:hypothetical protein
MQTSNTDYTFILDDGTTTLTSSGANITASLCPDWTARNGMKKLLQGLGLHPKEEVTMTYTFVGTGASVVTNCTSASDTYTITVDCAAIGNVSAGGNITVNNLQLGTHTLSLSQ